MTIDDRFFAKVRMTDGCWLWLGSKDDGYGRISIGGGVRKYAHRVMFETVVGPVPVGLELDHLCRNRACVRPDHLEMVTRRENLHRGETSARKTHCPYGHPYDERNTLRAAGRRHCRACRAIRYYYREDVAS